MTEPLTTADVDIRDFPYMPLDVVRLRDSECVIMCTAEEFRAAVILWCASWHQVPAASLPDDDRLLASLAGFGRDVDGWQNVREGALRGFVKCTDGRLYHPVIAEKAIEAWQRKWDRPDRAEARTAKATRAAKAKWKSEPDKRTRSERLAAARAIATHTDDDWKRLLNACGNACVRCGESETIVKDHITPIYQGGSDGIDNLQPLCRRCNCSKGPENKDHRPHDWRDKMTANACSTPALRGKEGNREEWKRKEERKKEGRATRADAVVSFSGNGAAMAGELLPHELPVTGPPAGYDRPPDATLAKAKVSEIRYAFDGDVIRLNATDFEKWRVAFAHLDLRSELTARDAWLAERGHDEQKRWFISTSQHLANKNAQRKLEAARARYSDDDENLRFVDYK